MFRRLPVPLTTLNIALVILHADPARGGAERYTVDLARALASLGHTVTLVATTFSQIDDRVRPVPLAAAAPTRLGRYLRFLDALDAHLAERRYDVVHAMLPVRRCDVYHPHAGVAAEAVARGHAKHAGALRRAMARVGNAMNRKRQEFAAVERELLAGPRPPVVLCLSEYVKRSVRAHHPALPDARLATLFNATDLARFNPAARPDAGRLLRERLGISSEKVVALMIAQDFARKGLSEAIAALARVADPRLVLLVVGKPDPASYHRLAERLGVAERVIFNGPTVDPHPFYRSADLFVLPTRHDPCSLVVLEALAMGVPVISTAQNGACEIMSDGTHGFVLPDPGNVDRLAAALREMLDPARRERMRQACLDLRPALAYERHVERLAEIYVRRRGVGDPSPKG